MITLTQAQVLDAFRATIVSLTGLPSDSVLFSFEDSTYPTSDFVWIRKLRDTAVGMGSWNDTETARWVPHRLDIQIEARGSTSAAHEALSRALDNLRGLTSSRVSLSNLGVSVVKIGMDRDRSGKLGPGNELREVHEVSLRYTRETPATPEAEVDSVALDNITHGGLESPLTTIYTEVLA